jgi:hypothetical protein
MKINLENQEVRQALNYVLAARDTSKRSSRESFKYLHVIKGRIEATNGWFISCSNITLTAITDNDEVKNIEDGVYSVETISKKFVHLNKMEDCKFADTERLFKKILSKTPKYKISMTTDFLRKILANAGKYITFTFYDNLEPIEIQSTIDEITLYSLLVPCNLSEQDYWKPEIEDES